MFKQTRLIYFEALPPMRKGPRKGPSSRPSPNVEKRKEIFKELIKEQEEEEKQQNERVAEKLMDELELLGIKCPVCGSKNVKDITSEGVPDPKYSKLFCQDCRHLWLDEK